MKYLKKYENINDDIDENYISDIFYSLRAYGMRYETHGWLSNGVIRDRRDVSGVMKHLGKISYYIRLVCHDLIVNDNMLRELQESINHYEYFTKNTFNYLKCIARDGFTNAKGDIEVLKKRVDQYNQHYVIILYFNGPETESQNFLDSKPSDPTKGLLNF
jgi:hypothetical protein